MVQLIIAVIGSVIPIMFIWRVLTEQTPDEIYWESRGGKPKRRNKWKV